MKKTLLLSCLMAGGLVSSAAEYKSPVACPDASFQCMSTNGDWVVSEVYGVVTIYNISTGESEVFGEESMDRSLGLGNCVSDAGVVLGSTDNLTNACYYDGKTWKMLNVPNATLSNCSNGITPDGSRICGSVGCAPISVDGDNLMLQPAYWDRNADGTYSNCVLLPYPEKDFSGRTPQYVTAVHISDDGKAIFGQITDCSGFTQQPIVYLQGEDGKWTYKLLLNDLFHPEGVVFPEQPGDSPVSPQLVDYMTDEQRQRWQEDYQAWVNSGYQSTYPAEEDYVSADAKAKYDADYAKYEEEYNAWNEKYMAYNDVFWSIAENIPEMVFNAVTSTPDGKSYVGNAEMPDPDNETAWGWPATKGCGVVIDVETGEMTKIEASHALNITGVLDNNVMVGYDSFYDVPSNGYIIEGSKVTNLADWLSAKSDAMAEWVKSELTHEIESYDWETEETTYGEYVFTGMPVASAKLDVVAFWCMPTWNTDLYAMGYIVDLRDQSGIKTIGAVGKAKVAFAADGSLVLGNDVAIVEVYDLSGRLVLAAEPASSTLANTLASGVYVVHTTDASGNAATAKVAK